MRSAVTRSSRGTATALLLTVALALAGCGGGGNDAASSTAPAAPATDRATALVLAVCTQSTRAVPEVPGPDAPAADGRRYVRAVESAMRTLAPDVDRLAERTPGRRAVLLDLADRMRRVADVARRTPDGRATGDGANDLASAIARLNVAATRERLLQCGL